MKIKFRPLPAFFFYPLLFLFVIWFVFWLDKSLDLNLHRYGIYPRSLKGLKGILFSPFLHSNLKHIFNNSIPLFVLTAFLFYHYRSVAWKILFWGFIMTGLGTWILGRGSYHIGFSGINYMLIAFLFFSGIIIGYYRLMAVSLIVVFLYGSLIWLMFPIVDRISWEGHVSGFISGIILAFLYGKKLKNKYPDKNFVKINPEDDAFLSHFDENGNFIENIEENPEKEKTLSS